MKKLLLLLLIACFFACTNETVEDEQTQSELQSVDPKKVKPPTGG